LKYFTDTKEIVLNFLVLITNVRNAQSYSEYFCLVKTAGRFIPLYSFTNLFFCACHL